MELRQLRHLVAVVEFKSFTGAAAELHMSQPALSQSIARLEGELGCQLLNRNRRSPGAGLTPTVAGQTLLTDAIGILEAVDRAVERTKRVSDGDRAKVVVGFASATPTRYIKEAMRLDDLAVEIVPKHFGWGEAWPRLKGGEIDMGFVLGPPGEDFGLVDLILIDHFQRFLALPDDHDLATKPFLTVQDLGGLPLIDPGYEDLPPLRAFWLLEPWPAGVERGPIVSTPSVAIEETLVSVASGIGAWVTSSIVAEQFPRAHVSYVPLRGVDPVQVSLARLPEPPAPHAASVYKHLAAVLNAPQ